MLVPFLPNMKRALLVNLGWEIIKPLYGFFILEMRSHRLRNLEKAILMLDNSEGMRLPPKRIKNTWKNIPTIQRELNFRTRWMMIRKMIRKNRISNKIVNHENLRFYIVVFFSSTE